MDDPRALPPLVVRAALDAVDLGFAHSCRPEVGRLLRALVAARPAARVAESGTGVGVGAAWMLDGLDAAGRLVTVEREETRWASARRLLDHDPRVEVLLGDWRRLHEKAPFDVLFCDGGGKRDDPTAVVDLLAPAGVLVLDDFTPSPGWPPMHDGVPDDLRIGYLTDERLDTVEVAVAADAAVVIGVRHQRPR